MRLEYEAYEDAQPDSRRGRKGGLFVKGDHSPNEEVYQLRQSKRKNPFISRGGRRIETV